jgi:hypothetical protein
MSGDRTILRPSQARFAINEVAYIKASAVRGFIEPIVIVGVRYEPALNEYVYTFSREFKKSTDNSFNPPMRLTLAPIELRESMVLFLCEALDIQIRVLSKELEDAQKQLADNCVEPQQPQDPPAPVRFKQMTITTVPRFGHNEFVYLRESAEVLGRLEGFRIDGIEWNADLNQWVYVFTITPRPGKHMTVGDRGDMTYNQIIRYPEIDLCKICEALPLVVNFLGRAVARATLRQQSYCSEGSDSGSSGSL